MSVRVQSDGKQAVIGDKLNQSQIEALASISVQPDHILEHMDDLNDELSTVYTVEEKEQRIKQKKLPKTEMKTRKKSFFKRKNEEPEDMSLDNDLEELERLVQEDQALKSAERNEYVEESTGGTMKEQIMDLLKKTPGAPNERGIQQLKNKYGENAVHVMAFGEGDVYIYTHLRRGQWKKIQEIMAKIQETQNTDAEDALKEKVLQHCVLWPQNLPLEFFYNSRAGVVDSLYQVILLNSYFLSPQQAMLLTTQL
jgi:hypothetical protein